MRHAPLLLIPLALACQRSFNQGHATQGIELDVAFPEPLTCPQGELVTMGLEALSPEPTPADIGLKGNMYLQSLRKTRLELCVDYDAFKFNLKRVVTWTNQNGAGAWSARMRVLTNDSNAPDADLERALTQNDLSALHIEFPNPEASKPSFLVKGWKLADGRQIVTVSSFDKASGDPLRIVDSHDSAAVDMGVLTDGDPFTVKWNCQKKKHAFPNLELSYTLCVNGSHGTRIGYKFTSLTIDDTATAQPIHVAFQGMDANQHTRVKYTHHSFQDEFTFEIPKASYAIRFAEGGKMVLTASRDGMSPVDHPLTCGVVYECGTTVE